MGIGCIIQLAAYIMPVEYFSVIEPVTASSGKRLHEASDLGTGLLPNLVFAQFGWQSSILSSRPPSNSIVPH